MDRRTLGSLIFTHSSEKCGFLGAVKDDERELPLDISDNLIRGKRTTITKRSVSFNDNARLVPCLAQPVLLLENSNILYVAMEQAEDVVHNRKQPDNIRGNYWINAPL